MTNTAEDEAKLTTLRYKRGYKKQSLTKFFKELESMDLEKLSIEALIVYKEQLKNYYQAYDELNEGLFILGDKECDTASYEGPYMKHLITLSEIIGSKRQPPPQSSQNSQDHSIVNVKLPVIAIPTFTEKRALGFENAASSASCNSYTSAPVQRAQQIYKKKSSIPSTCNVTVKSAPTCIYYKALTEF